MMKPWIVVGGGHPFQQIFVDEASGEHDFQRCVQVAFWLGKRDQQA